MISRRLTKMDIRSQRIFRQGFLNLQSLDEINWLVYRRTFSLVVPTSSLALKQTTLRLWQELSMSVLVATHLFLQAKTSSSIVFNLECIKVRGVKIYLKMPAHVFTSSNVNGWWVLKMRLKVSLSAIAKSAKESLVNSAAKACAVTVARW